MKKETIHWVAICILLFILALGVIVIGVEIRDQNLRLLDVEQKTSFLISGNPANSNVIDPYTSTFGDRVGNMVLLSIGPLPGIQDAFGYSNLYAKFRGITTLSGNYSYFRNEVTASNDVCFSVTNPQDTELLPKVAGQTSSNTDFCFSNVDLATQEFGPNFGKGTAKVVIDDFALLSASAAVTNQARLVKVVSKEPIAQ